MYTLILSSTFHTDAQDNFFRLILHENNSYDNHYLIYVQKFNLLMYELNWFNFNSSNVLWCIKLWQDGKLKVCAIN